MTRPIVFVRSIRFRLSVLYSLVVFALGGAILGVAYYFLHRNLRRLPLIFDSRVMTINGRPIIIQDIDVDTAQLVEQAITQRALDLLADYSIVALIVLFLLSLVVGWIIAGRALRPVADMTAVAREIQASDLSRRIGYSGPEDEMSRLAGTFDEMLERLDGAFHAQRRFLADTSHDLRTPLAVIRSNIDVLAADPEASLDEWREAGGIVQRNAERMAEMIDDLLAAARLEVRAAAMVQVDLAEQVTEMAVELGPRAAEVGVALEARAQPARIDGVPHSLRRAVANLVDNALKAAPSGSSVLIGTGTLDGWAWVMVADGGEGIDPAAVDQPGRAGLGLSIVKEIAEAHGGVLAAHRGSERGTAMVIWIPTVADPGPVPTGVPGPAHEPARLQGL
ncbi:MAG TPA: HAMP domain-containing sensor histidine kinase [Acidimicrobiia bacterium]|nr:HAMP domain-containing sensor histidine kinase [Acidimicrobiia bacterium]